MRLLSMRRSCAAGIRTLCWRFFRGPCFMPSWRRFRHEMGAGGFGAVGSSGKPSGAGALVSHRAPVGRLCNGELAHESAHDRAFYSGFEGARDHSIQLRGFPQFFTGRSRAAADKSRLRLVVAAKFRALKNPVLLMEALAIVRKREPSLNLSLDWYGLLPDSTSPTEDIVAYNTVVEEINRNSLQDCVKMQPAVLSIADVYRGRDAVISPSFFEGLSNVICEAMACGRLILMSSVSDAGNQVQTDITVFCSTRLRRRTWRTPSCVLATCPIRKRGYGRAKHEMAKQMFDPSIVAAKYAEILSAAAEAQKDGHRSLDTASAGYGRGLCGIVMNCVQDNES